MRHFIANSICSALIFFSFFELSNQADISCKERPVENCPTTSESWNAAAERRNCSTDRCGSRSVYHCLPTENGTLVEVCAEPINLNYACPYYDTVGESIQRSDIFCNSTDSTNCTAVDSSNTIYQFPVCHSLQGNTIADAALSEATRLHHDATRYWIFFLIKLLSNQMN